VSLSAIRADGEGNENLVRVKQRCHNLFSCNMILYFLFLSLRVRLSEAVVGQGWGPSNQRCGCERKF
jgi:hypothetical protein